MTAIVGFAIVLVTVFGAFAISGGHLLLVFEPWHEWIIICGAALGGLIVKTSPRTLKLTWRKIVDVFRSRRPERITYMQVLQLIHDLTFLSRRDGIIALESHIQEPQASAIFAKYPRVMERPLLVKFLCDNLKIVVIGGVNVADLELLIAADIETIQEEIAAPQHILANTADAFPALGIVAAVLGVIRAMSSIAEGPEVVGTRVAAALVGTFLGVLISYGFVGPLSVNIDMANQEEIRLLQIVKAGVMAIARGLNPKLSAEYARRAIYEGERPTFEELEQILKAGS